MVNLSFDHYLKRITVLSPATELSIQDLYNQCKEEETFPYIATTEGVIATATGKEPLGGGIFVGITVTMRNGWKVGFEARGTPTAVQTTGGNLVAESGIVGDQFFQTTNVQIQYASSSSATLQQQQNIENIEQRIESLAQTTATGTTYYWDPYGGDDLNDGFSKSNPVLTFTKAQSLCNNGDLIVLFGTNPSGVTYITESLNITKDDLHIRGTGRNVVFTPTDDTKPTIEVNASDVELRNFQAITAGTGTNDVILVKGQRCQIVNITVAQFTGNGICLVNGHSSKISDCEIGIGGNDGIKIVDSYYCEIEKCAIVDCGNNGLELTATNIQLCDKNILRDSIIHSNNGYQIRVGTLVNEFMIHNDNNIRENGFGRLFDEGTNTIDAELNIKQEIFNVGQAVEALGENGGAGNVYYWDPLYGNDVNDGLTENTSRLTFQSIHDNLVIAGNDDIVYIRIPDPNVTHVTITENIVIDKNSVHLRGLGSHTKFRPTSGVAITITAHHCEISDFEIDHRDIVGTYNGIEHNTGGDLMLKRIIFTNITGAGFLSNGRNYNELYSCFFEGCATGIQVDNSDDLLIKDTKINKSIGDGIDITSTGVGACDNIHVENCIITHNGGYGVDIGTDVSRVVIDDGCVIAGNTLGRVRDNGISTIDAEIYKEFPIAHGFRSLDR